jgi:hypothetical protein
MSRLTKSSLTTIVLLLGSSTACISDEEFNEKRLSLDEDGDGCEYSNDCDDADGTRGECLVEIPYDGIDNDCSTGAANIDEVDVDGDGIPGIPYETWIENGGVESGWPETVETTEGILDCRDVTPEQLENYLWADWAAEEGSEPDEDFAPLTHESAAAIFPGADDLVYDGIDSNCDGANDFDADADGYMPPATDLLDPDDSSSQSFEEAFDAYVTEWGYTLDQNYGDCFDIGDVGLSNVPSETINPGVSASDDDWYDGIDQDCSGNNDFDQDADGYLPSGYDDDYVAFVELHYGTDDPPWGDILVGVDCLDEEDSNLSVSADLIHPGADDAPYNGVDEDCVGDNDFDLDLDGYRIVDMESEYTTYTTDWTYSTIPGTQADDCDDTVSSTFPGALETLGDGDVDGDCDGGEDTSIMVVSDGWERLSRPVALMTDTDYIITGTAQSLDDGSTLDSNIGYDFRIEKNISPYSPWQTGSGYWLGPENDNPVSIGHEALAMADRYYAATAYSQYDASEDRTTTWLLVSRNVRNQAGSYDPLRQSHAWWSDDEYTGMDLISDSGTRLWAFACGEESLHFLTVSDDADEFLRDKWKTVSMTAVSNPTCFLSPTTLDSTQAQGTVCSAAGCTTYDLDGSASSAITEASSSPWASEDFIDTGTRDGWLIAARASGGVHVEDLSDGTQYSILDSYNVVSADMLTIGGTTYVLFVREKNSGDRVLILAYGELGGSSQGWTEVQLDLSSTGLEAEKASISGDADRLFLTVSGTANGSNNDGVAWTFIAPN